MMQYKEENVYMYVNEYIYNFIFNLASYYRDDMKDLCFFPEGFKKLPEEALRSMLHD